MECPGYERILSFWLPCLQMEHDTDAGTGIFIACFFSGTAEAFALVSSQISFGLNFKLMLFILPFLHDLILSYLMILPFLSTFRSA